MIFTIKSAEEQLPMLVDAAIRGEDIVITQNNKPAVRLLAIAQSKFRSGSLDKELGEIPDFFEDMPGDEVEAWETNTGASING